MYAVETDPLPWALEFIVCQSLTTVLQLCAAVVTLHVTHLPVGSSTLIPHVARKYTVLLTTLCLLCYASYRLWDSDTHLIGSMMSGLSLAFIVPLQASAYLYDNSCAHKSKQQDPKQNNNNKRVILETLLHIAIPSATPSRRHPALPVRAHLVRGVAFIAFTVVYRLYVASVLFRDPLVLDWELSACALMFVFIGASGVLHMTAYGRSLLMATIPKFFSNNSSRNNSRNNNNKSSEADGDDGGEGAPAPFVGIPILAESQADFWARRWNLPVSHSLRSGVTRPLVHLCHWPVSLAVIAAFIVSGVSHEVILRFGNVHNSSGEWLLFFILAGIGTVLEKSVSVKLNVDASPIKRFVRRIMGIVYTVGLFHSLFVPITISSRLAHKAVDAYGAGEIVFSALYRYATGLA